MTQNISLNKPAQGTQDWHTPLNNNFTIIEDGVNQVIDFGSMFNVQPTDPASMALDVLPGVIFDLKTVTTKGKQTTSNFAAPSNDDRIDRVVADKVNGTVSVVTGSEASNPSAPNFSEGKVPLAQVYLTPSTSSLTESDLTDERSWLPNGHPIEMKVDGTTKYHWTVDVDTNNNEMNITTS